MFFCAAQSYTDQRDIKSACDPSQQYPDFHSKKWLGEFLLPPGWDATL